MGVFSRKIKEFNPAGTNLGRARNHKDVAIAVPRQGGFVAGSGTVIHYLLKVDL
jgi:hypothetical protein